LVVSYWNSLKGGGDTATKLLDDCQDRVSKRTDTLVSCARLLLQMGIQFHRLHHIVTNSKPVKEYGSISPYRDDRSEDLYLPTEMIAQRKRDSDNSFTLLCFREL